MKTTGGNEQMFFLPVVYHVEHILSRRILRIIILILITQLFPLGNGTELPK